MKRKTRFTIAMSIAVILLIIVFGGSLGFHFVKNALIAQALANFRPPPSIVSATTSKTVHWRPYIQAIGTLTAINGVEVSNAIAGKVVKIEFQSGGKVKQGALLAQLDTTQQRAQLAQFQAQLELAKTKYQRVRTLRKKGLNSKQALDTARSNYKSAQAQLANEQAIIDKMSINAPFDGHLGIRQINLGQYLAAGTTIVKLEQLEPLLIDFTLPQADFSKLHHGQDIAVDVDAYPGHDFAGKITAISPAVSEQSRSLQAQATIPNNQKLLRPGMFATIKILADQTERKIVVPQTAISYSLYGDTVYVLKPVTQTTGTATGEGQPGQSAKAGPAGGGKSKTAAGGAKKAGPTVYVANQVFVKTGAQRGKLIAVTGIKPGVKVVTSGQIKLHPGSHVMINNSVDLGKNRKLVP